MTKRKMREIEKRIRITLEEPYNPTDERIAEIKQKAFMAYEQYVKVQEKKQSIWGKLNHYFCFRHR